MLALKPVDESLVEQQSQETLTNDIGAYQESNYIKTCTKEEIQSQDVGREVQAMLVNVGEVELNDRSL